VEGKPAVRGLVWLTFAGYAAFVVSWVVAGTLEPHYSHLEQGVSELAARNAAHPWIVTAGIAALAVSLGALGAALAPVLPRRRALPVALFAAAAVATALVAAFQLDCGMAVDHRCEQLWRAGQLSWHQDAHLWADFAGQVLLLFTPFALARSLWPGTVAMVALGAGVTGVVIALLSFAAYNVPGVAGGLVQRAGLGVLLVWVVTVGVGILHATRRPSRPGRLVSVRPRDFLARGWTGDGELVLRPFFLGRLFAQRCEATRASTPVSEQVWRIDDRADFGGGRSESRQMYADFVAGDHVRLTAGDLPDGADVWLEEGGFRISDFRMAWPIGPLPVTVRCVDRSYVEPDGTLVNRIDVCTLGPRIPLARATFRVRPTPVSHSEPGARHALA
jgi:hypothetical protein